MSLAAESDITTFGGGSAAWLDWMGWRPWLYISALSLESGAWLVGTGMFVTQEQEELSGWDVRFVRHDWGWM
jgi:hypothetical protein